MLSTATRHKSNVLLDVLGSSLINGAARKALFLSITRLKPASSYYSTEPGDPHKKTRYVLPFLRGLDAAQIDLVKKGQAQLLSGRDKNDTTQVLEALNLLEGRRLLHALPPPQVEDGLQYLLKELSDGKLSLADTELYTRIALQATDSTTSSTDALYEFLLLRLKQKDFKAVIDLYDKYLKNSGGKEIWGVDDVEDESFSQGAGLVSDEYDREMQVTRRRMSLLLVTIAAHASQDAFESALHTYSETGTRFHPFIVDTFLTVNFAHDPAFAEKVKSFIIRLDLARMISRPTSLSKHIMNLATSHSTKPLENLYKSVAAGLFGPDAYIAPELTQKTPKKVVALTEVGWATFLSAFLKRRRRDLASKLWEDQLALGLTPGVSLWTTLIDSLGAINEADDAVASWNVMKAQGVQPDPLTYRALIAALFKSRRRTQAWVIFQTFQNSPFPEACEGHLLSVYNTVFDGLLSFNDETAVQDLLEKMEKQGPKPDAVCYNTLLAYYGRRGNFKGLAKVIGRMVESKVMGDVYTFSTILSALLRAGRDDAPDLMINIMRKQGIQPNVATYSAIINHQLQAQTIESFEMAMRLLYRMEDDAAAQPNVKTYTSILAGLNRIEGMDSKRKNEWRKEITWHMKKRHIHPNEVTYNILIDSSLKHPSSEGLEQALSYYRTMRGQKLTNDRTWYILFLGLLRRKNWLLAEDIIKDMLASGHRPSVAVEHLIAKFQQLDKDSIQVN